jgi:hypothetical protein
MWRPGLSRRGPDALRPDGTNDESVGGVVAERIKRTGRIADEILEPIRRCHMFISPMHCSHPQGRPPVAVKKPFALCVSRFAPATVLLASLAACGTTEHFIDRPRLTIDGTLGETRQVVAQLFRADTPYSVKLCEADQESNECKKDSNSISATGVGGLFLPLALHVSGLHVSQRRVSSDGLALDVAFESTANGIPPLCVTAQAAVIARDNSTASIEIDSFYCNWMLVGNVVAYAELSIDRINLKDKTFTGYYKLAFHGTGNVAGSGYYRAVIAPISPKAT